jgi:hypothetical protein
MLGPNGREVKGGWEIFHNEESYIYTLKEILLGWTYRREWNKSDTGEMKKKDTEIILKD